MDVPRGKEVARKKLIRRIVVIAVIVAAIPLITWGLSRLKPAAPSVDRATVWIDAVKRGPMLREVRGLGTLVVEEFVWIPAQFEARVEKINFLPGAKVHPNDVVMILKQPQMELDASDLEAQTKQAEAQYDNMRVQLQSAQLAQQAITEQVKSDMEQASLQADRDRQLNKLDLKSDVDTKVSQAKYDDLKNRYTLSKKQLDISGESIKVKLEGEAPGMRPDLSVDGQITIERLADVVFVGRPVIGQPGAKITLFKLDADGKEAQRIPVSLGRSSVNTIEVVDGLKVGDQVILSDMSTWDAHNRIRLN